MNPEKEYYNVYEEKLKSKGMTIAPAECKVADRTELFMELYRSGIELIAIDGADHADEHFFQDEIWSEILSFFKKKL